MSLKNCCVKTCSTPFPSFSIDAVNALPSLETDMLLVEGRKHYLFHNDQISVLKEMAARLLELLNLAPIGKRDCAAGNTSFAEKPLITALADLICFVSKKHGLGCIGCNFCKGLASFKESLDLLEPVDVKRFAYAVTPQILPDGLSDLGRSVGRIEPFSINIVEKEGPPIYIPILDDLNVEERVKLFDLVRKIHEVESRSLSSISLDLGEVAEERTSIAKKLGRVGERLIPYAVYSSVGLSNLFPPLLDDDVSEFFIDRESSLVYLDHRDYGRCNSSIYVGSRDMSHLITFARMSSGKVLNHQSPSIRSSIRTAEFYVRISADAPPLSLEGTSMAVRKFFSKPITLEELVSNSTLTQDALVYLAEQLRLRRNISIYGESGSGKTTLAVALDLITPLIWRKISVESDVAENVSQFHLGKHQIRLLAGSSSKSEQERRTMVLNSLLHKSPDYVFFGEVLSREDSESLFQILAAGLKCIHTIHAESAESLLRRWALQHSIPAQSLKDLDVLVEMRRNFGDDRIIRRVNRISELVKDSKSGIPEILDVFRWDERTCALKMVPDEERLASIHAESSRELMIKSEGQPLLWRP